MKFTDFIHKGIILLFLITPPGIKSQNQWNIISPIGTGNGLASIISINDETAMAVGGAGTLIKTSNAGNTWNVISTGYNYNFTCIFSTDENNIYISTSNQYFLTSSDGGNNWISNYDNDLSDIASIYFTTENIGYAAGSYGRAFGYIYKTTDRGISWEVSRETGFSKMKKVFFLNESTGFAIGDDGQIFKTTNSGTSWINHNSPVNQPLYDISFYNENTGFIAGGSGTIFKTTDAGDNWIPVTYNVPYSAELRNINVKDSLNIILTGDEYGSNGVTFYSTNGGLNWNNYIYSGAIPIWPTIRSISKLMSNYFLGCSLNGNIYKFDNIEHSMSISNALTDFDLNGVDFVNGNTGYVCGKNGLIFKTLNAGQSWSKLFTYAHLNLVSIKAIDENNIIAGGYSMIGGAGLNVLLKSTNGGMNFTNSEPNIDNSEIRYFNFPKNSSSGKDIYLITEKSLWPPIHGSYYILFRSIDFGVNWYSLYSNYNYFSSAFFYNEITGYIGFNSGEIKRTTNGGGSWHDLSVNAGGDMVHNIFFPSPDTGYVTGNVLKKTTNGGNSWFTVSDSSFTPGSIFFKDNNNGILYGNGRIQYTTTGGAHWIPQISVGGVNSITVTENNKGYGVGNRGLLMYNNNSFIVGINNSSDLIPEKSELYQNYPNPFNPTTKITFEIPFSGNVKLIVFDLLGREIKSMLNEKLSPGKYSYDFDGSDLPSGVYYYKLVTDNFIETKKMILLK